MKGRKTVAKVKYLNVAFPVPVYDMLASAVKRSVVKTDMTRLIQDAVVEKFGSKAS